MEPVLQATRNAAGLRLALSLVLGIPGAMTGVAWLLAGSPLGLLLLVPAGFLAARVVRDAAAVFGVRPPVIATWRYLVALAAIALGAASWLLWL